ncbi:MAG: Rha family transcriptional regulator [Desulfovibrio sp.]|jgi:Rha family phage regulatory protein|nr:Rha family transcriptional regulator [Desulfovibrio sp.]
MATETLPQTVISVEFLSDGETPTVSSLEVAKHFQKKHKDILREIERIRSICPKLFFGRNFTPNEYKDSIGRTLPCYRLTRDAFSLLAMGFTGKNAIQWKLRYIEAFNALEAAVLENARSAALEQGKALALAEGRAEGAKAAMSLTEFGKKQLTRIVRYHKLGLSNKEVGKLLDIADKYVTDRLWLARRLGLLPPARLSARQREILREGRAVNAAKGV